MEQAIVYIGIDVEPKAKWPCGFSALAQNKPSADAVNLRGQWRLRAGIVESLAEEHLQLRWCKPYACVSTRVQLASWLKPIESMRECWQLSARRCDPSPPDHFRANRSVCANWSPSVGI